jgi:hypothetical protein
MAHGLLDRFASSRRSGLRPPAAVHLPTRDPFNPPPSLGFRRLHPWPDVFENRSAVAHGCTAASTPSRRVSCMRRSSCSPIPTRSTRKKKPHGGLRCGSGGQTIDQTRRGCRSRCPKVDSRLLGVSLLRTRRDPQACTVCVFAVLGNRIRTRNVRLSPRGLISSVAPCRSATSFTMASPSPDPSPLVPATR